MRSPLAAGKSRFSFKASHRRMSLRISHHNEGDARSSELHRPAERPPYIAPPKKR